MARLRNWFDKNVEKVISRKFLAWLVSCGFIGAGVLSSEDFTAITLMYVGSQGLIDAAVQWKHGKQQ